MMRLHPILAAAALLALNPAPAAPQEAAPFRWTGTVEAGRTVEIRGVNGRISAVPSDDATVRVEATRQARRADPGSVRIEVVQHPGGVTLCAVYPTPPGSRRQNECRPGGGQNNIRDNDTQVNFVVRVPAGVRFEGHTVNGGVEVDGLASDVRAATVNGSVRIRTSGLAQASTVNGNIVGRVGSNRVTGDLRFETVNGSIELEMPGGIHAEFNASTVNGRIDTDFPITVSGRVSPRSLRGTIGEGGHELRLSTVNGSIRVRRI
jgi:hypothetical protein